AEAMLQSPAAPVMPAAEPTGLILADAERGVLAAMRGFDLWPGEAISWAAVEEAAILRGFDEEGVRRALASLRAKDCVRDLDAQRITLTRTGFLAA
ncbi:MAG TPA: hypothetical protein VIP08_03760, partial [Phenylobacterium sp.]